MSDNFGKVELYGLAFNWGIDKANWNGETYIEYYVWYRQEDEYENGHWDIYGIGRTVEEAIEDTFTFMQENYTNISEEMITRGFCTEGVTDELRFKLIAPIYQKELLRRRAENEGTG